MGLFDVFSKGGKYFGKAIEPKCEYCDYGNRSKDGNKVLCTKKGLVDAGYHCPKFLYSPLKRIPVKQLERVGWLEGDYEEKDFDEIKKQKEAAEQQAVAEVKQAAAEMTAKAKAEAEEIRRKAEAEAAAIRKKAEADAAKKTAEAAKLAEQAAKNAAAAAKPAVTAPQAARPAAQTTTTVNVPPVTPQTSVRTPAAQQAPTRPTTPVMNGGDLASLAAMAESAGEYVPPVQEAAKPEKAAPDLSAPDLGTLSNM